MFTRWTRGGPDADVRGSAAGAYRAIDTPEGIDPAADPKQEQQQHPRWGSHTAGVQRSCQDAYERRLGQRRRKKLGTSRSFGSNFLSS